MALFQRLKDISKEKTSLKEICECIKLMDITDEEFIKEAEKGLESLEVCTIQKRDSVLFSKYMKENFPNIKSLKHINIVERELEKLINSKKYKGMKMKKEEDDKFIIFSFSWEDKSI